MPFHSFKALSGSPWPNNDVSGLEVTGSQWPRSNLSTNCGVHILLLILTGWMTLNKLFNLSSFLFCEWGWWQYCFYNYWEDEINLYAYITNESRVWYSLSIQWILAWTIRSFPQLPITYSVLQLHQFSKAPWHCKPLWFWTTLFLLLKMQGSGLCFPCLKAFLSPRNKHALILVPRLLSAHTHDYTLWMSVHKPVLSTGLELPKAGTLACLLQCPLSAWCMVGIQ